MALHPGERRIPPTPLTGAAQKRERGREVSLAETFKKNRKRAKNNGLNLEAGLGEDGAKAVTGPRTLEGVPWELSREPPKGEKWT